MNKKNNWKLKFCVVAISIALLSCSNDQKNPLEGKWTSLQPKEKAFGIDFELNFGEGNSFVSSVKGGSQDGVYSGYYLVDKDTLKIVDISDKPIILCNYADTGIYTFQNKGDTVLFTVIKDLCERRKLTLEIGLLKKP